MSKVGIALIGPSGTGKSTVGKLLALELGLEFHDMDDDGLEGEWGPGGVADYLLKHGDDGFLAAEEQFTLDNYGRRDEHKKYTLDNMLFGTSGSLVLEPEAMSYIRERMIIIYLKTPLDEIERRLDARGINRIVGMNGENPRFSNVREVLDYRKDFYDASADIICHLEPGSSAEEDTLRVKAFIERYIQKRSNGSYYSYSILSDSRTDEVSSLRNAIVKSQPLSGGLWTLTHFPQISLDEIEEFGEMEYREIAESLLTRWNFGVNAPVLRSVIREAYGSQWHHKDITPVRKMGADNIFALHLGYGPTFAFKNIALEFLPRILEKIAPEKHIHVLGASSGDTINAAHSGVKNTSIKSIFMLPGVGPSSVQKLQATNGIRNNPKALTILADIPFDPLQDVVKKINSSAYTNFRTEHDITSFNSINIARILAQIVYYFRAYSKLVHGGFINAGNPVIFSIPSGNFGNALAGFYAKMMGLPIEKIHIATNENDMLDTFFKTGRYEPPRKDGKDYVEVTNAPSMDIAKSSNLERLIYEACGQDSKQVQSWYTQLSDVGYFQIDETTLANIQYSFSSSSSTNEERLGAIKKWTTKYSYPIDPHSAAGIVPLIRGDFDTESMPVVFLETSHIVQFEEELKGVGIKVPRDPLIGDIFAKLEKTEAIAGQDFLEIKNADFASLFDAITEAMRVLDTGKKEKV